MRRRNRMGYKGYQGRGGGSSTFLKILVCILAILVVAGGGYLLAQQGGISLPSLPSFATQKPDETQEPGQTDTTPDPENSTSPAPTAQPSQAPSITPVRAVEVTLSQLLDGSAQRRVEQADCDALVVEVKGEWGKLQWPSQAALAQQLGVISSTQSLTETLNSLAQQEIYLVARVDCFRDQAMSAANAGGSLLMTRGGNRWYDSMGMSWVSPVNQQVRDYVTQLCVELSKMGFDELVLDSAYFPDQGEVHVLAQSDNYPEARTAPVETFWKQVSQAVKDSGVVLSAQVRGDSLLDGGAITGMTPKMLDQYAQRVWVTLEGVDQTQVQTVLTQAGVDQARQITGQEAASGQMIWG
ncbi:putative glycoside hydrolase [Pseudoflavonifractor sp. An85]|uniref:putative glycoside hydrolase n=1 Tax=Pseudoflavonifractor sp. An85 TaxID=1965661 RepID=UPI00117A806C|nr:putative glycoside hydrolase [Pseudoflavonifractor sp. An85]